MNIIRQVRALLGRAAILRISTLFLIGFVAPLTARFHFALLGDRSGETIPGVFEQACKEAAKEHPAFFLTVGDTIQGGNDKTASQEWRKVLASLTLYHAFRFYYTPGNHDVWSPESAQLYRKFSGHALHYSLDYQAAHFTILDDSQTDDLPASELEFLQADLEAHKTVPVKFVVSHRPFWLLHVVLKDSNFSFHQLAKKYGVQYVIAGHIHQMLHFELDGVTYLSIASSGGHLRNDKSYAHGWFFQHGDVVVQGTSAQFNIEELGAPFGKGRVTHLSDWGAAGLVSGSRVY